MSTVGSNHPPAAPSYYGEFPSSSWGKAQGPGPGASCQSRSPPHKGQRVRGGHWNNERPQDPDTSLMCPQWMGTPTSSSKSQRKTMPSASTLTKSQAQCCASFRTPSQVWLQAGAGARGSSWEGLEISRVLTLPITHPSLSADHMLEGAVQNHRPAQTPRGQCVGKMVRVKGSLALRGGPSLYLGSSFSLNIVPGPGKGQIYNVGPQPPA